MTKKGHQIRNFRCENLKFSLKKVIEKVLACEKFFRPPKLRANFQVSAYDRKAYNELAQFNKTSPT